MGMPLAAINWITFHEDDIKRAREVIRSFEGESTVDSLGLGLPVEQLSNLIFPATSTLHSRLRYQIFVVSIYYKMFFEARDRKLPNPEKRLFQLENQLLNILLKNDPTGGVIGRISREELNAWPSKTYWGSINYLKLFGKPNVKKSQIYRDIKNLSKPHLVNDDEEGIDDEIDGAITFEDEIIKMMESFFLGDKFRDDLNFELTNREAKFFKKKIEEAPNGKNSLLYSLLSKSNSELESKQRMAFFSKTNNKILDELIKQSLTYSKVSMGIMYAYRFALSSHRANVVFENNIAKKKEWNEYSQNNIANFEQWGSVHMGLQNWDLQELKNAMNAYQVDTKIDPLLNDLFLIFSDTWKKGRSTKNIVQSFASVCEFHESKRRANKNHFTNPMIKVPNNTKGLDPFGAILFDFRLAQGVSNAKDIVKGLGKRK